MAKLGEKQRSFLDENPFVGTVTTLRADGSPHSTIVWVDVDDPNNTYKWVAVSGPAEVTESGADAQIDKLAKKYLGKDEYPWRNPAEQRVKVVIEPDKVDASGFDN